MTRTIPAADVLAAIQEMEKGAAFWMRKAEANLAEAASKGDSLSVHLAGVELARAVTLREEADCLRAHFNMPKPGAVSVEEP